ncbi:hypothetical protein [uncultured Microscilla sp.]|uniref:hypothetical protein n=1 Tax=uncultured Microscilla sp. TaxID=432653 RepID=UPI0026091335|nr:hypothetical protein [uncultured Microscilla sp.]
MLFDRIKKVKQRGGQKLTIEIGPNSYKGYPQHTAFIKQSVVDGLQKGDRTQFDALTHEIDHAVRFEGLSLEKDELFKALKSEIFALHAQIFTVINLLHAGVKTVKFYNVVVLDTYVENYNKKFKNKEGSGYTLDGFLLALSKEDKNTLVLLTEYIAFYRYILVRKAKKQSLKSLDYQEDVKSMAKKYLSFQAAKKQYNLVLAADKNLLVYFTEP